MAAPAAPAAPVPRVPFAIADVPKFTGRNGEDVEAWAIDIVLLWELAQLHGVVDNTFLNMIRLRLAGSARQFLERAIHDNHQAGLAPHTVVQALAILQERFVRPDQQIHLRNQMQRLRQAASALTFNESFDLLRIRLVDASDEEVKAHYLNGLKPNIKRALIGANLNATVDELMQMAVRADELWQPYQPFAPYQPAPPRPPFVAPAAPGAPGPAQPPRPTIPKLTQEERQQLMATGGCFRCRQPGHLSSACPNVRR